jgi:hypothetical protein
MVNTKQKKRKTRKRMTPRPEPTEKVQVPQEPMSPVKERHFVKKLKN